MRLVLVLVLTAAKGSAAAQFQDTAKLHRSARSAEAEYERAARRLAPLGPGPGRGDACDEFVGRFCLYYDAGRDTLPTEPAEIGEYRNRAIDALRASYAVNPARRATVFPLIRILLEGKQAQAAVQIAEEYRRSSGDVAIGNMLLGLTRHASADIQGAERAFADWLNALDTASVRRVTDVSYLLDSRERNRYRRMAAGARQAYHDRFWRYADALYLTPGNETWTEHLGRHAESELLRSAPFVMGSTSWGSDVAELTIRYGTVKGRSRTWSSAPGSSDLRITEYWDPEQVIYAAPALDSALKVHAQPRGGWPLDTIRTISGHAPSTLRRMLPLEHSASVFADAAGRLLRVDAVLPLDTLARADPNGRAVLFVLDSLLQVISVAPGFVNVIRDSMFAWSEAKLPPAGRFYSMEIFEQKSRLAGRARFAIRFGAANSLQLSDLLITDAFEPGELPRHRADARLKPRASLLLREGMRIGIYAEANVEGERPRNLRVRLRVMNAKRRDATTAMSWIEEINSEGVTPIAATVALDRLKAGRYLLELSVTDQEGRTGVATRELLILPD